MRTNLQSVIAVSSSGLNVGTEMPSPVGASSSQLASSLRLNWRSQDIWSKVDDSRLSRCKRAVSSYFPKLLDFWALLFTLLRRLYKWIMCQ